MESEKEVSGEDSAVVGRLLPTWNMFVDPDLVFDLFLLLSAMDGQSESTAK